MTEEQELKELIDDFHQASHGKWGDDYGKVLEEYTLRFLEWHNNWRNRDD